MTAATLSPRRTDADGFPRKRTRTGSSTTTGLGITTSLALIIAPWGNVPITDAPRFDSAWVSSETTGLAHSDSGTATGHFGTKPVQPAKDLSAVVSELKSESGLTADQLGRLLGVTRRSIHNWAAGSPVASIHEERVRDLYQRIMAIDATTPQQRRGLLLASSNGRSLFKTFAGTAAQQERVQFDVPVTERLGI